MMSVTRKNIYDSHTPWSPLYPAAEMPSSAALPIKNDNNDASPADLWKKCYWIWSPRFNATALAGYTLTIMTIMAHKTLQFAFDRPT